MCQRLDHEIRDCLEAKARKREAQKAKEEAEKRVDRHLVDDLREKTRNESPRISTAQSEEVYDRRREKEREYYPRRDREPQGKTQQGSRYHPYKRSTRDNSRERGSQQQSSFFQRHVQTSYPPRHQTSQDRIYKPMHKDNNTHLDQGSDRRGRPSRSQEFGTSSARDGKNSTESNRERAEHSSSVGGDPSPRVRNSVPKEAVELAMAQYTSCADPTESAARKERMRLAEAQGEIEETAFRMVQASMGPTTPVSPPVETPPRIPAVLRLGPANEESRMEKGTEPQTKHKPGRPSGRKKMQASPLKLTGPLAGKRKVPPKSQTRKRRTESSVTQGTRALNGGNDTAGGSRPQARKSSSTQSYENQPISSLLPPRSKRRWIFTIH